MGPSIVVIKISDIITVRFSNPLSQTVRSFPIVSKETPERKFGSVWHNRTHVSHTHLWENPLDLLVLNFAIVLNDGKKKIVSSLLKAFFIFTSNTQLTKINRAKNQLIATEHRDFNNAGVRKRRARSAHILNKHAVETDTSDPLQRYIGVGRYALGASPRRMRVRAYTCKLVNVYIARRRRVDDDDANSTAVRESDSPFLPISRQVNRHHGRIMFYPPRIIRITHDACRIAGSGLARGHAYLYF